MARRDNSGATSYDEATTVQRAESDATPRHRATEARDRRAELHEEAHDRFGGINWGAGFFGWLVAIGMTIILSGIVGAIVTAIGDNVNLTLGDAKSSAGTLGIAAGITLVVVLALAYFTGGYVAGRMSRFDGAKQGLATWLIGLVVTIIAGAVGAAFGSQYNVLNRVNLPRIPLHTDQLSIGAIITAVLVVVLTLLAAMLGGKVGHRYHDKVDRAAGINL